MSETSEEPVTLNHLHDCVEKVKANQEVLTARVSKMEAKLTRLGGLATFVLLIADLLR